MNCLLLLIILFCCNGNGGCNQNCNRGCNQRSCGSGREHERGCVPTPPPMPRTQFPYLDVEPRTCGCEEK